MATQSLLTLKMAGLPSVRRDLNIERRGIHTSPLYHPCFAGEVSQPRLFLLMDRLSTIVLSIFKLGYFLVCSRAIHCPLLTYGRAMNRTTTNLHSSLRWTDCRHRSKKRTDLVRHLCAGDCQKARDCRLDFPAFL